MTRETKKQETVNVCNVDIPIHRKCSWKDGPYDTYIATGFVGTRFGVLMWSRFGITEEVVFVWDSTRPFTPAVVDQLSTVPHVIRAIETTTQKKRQ